MGGGDIEQVLAAEGAHTDTSEHAYIHMYVGDDIAVDRGSSSNG